MTAKYDGCKFTTTAGRMLNRW